MSYAHQKASEEAWDEFGRRYPSIPIGKAAVTYMAEAAELNSMDLETGFAELAKRTRARFGLSDPSHPSQVVDGVSIEDHHLQTGYEYKVADERPESSKDAGVAATIRRRRDARANHYRLLKE